MDAGGVRRRVRRRRQRADETVAQRAQHRSAPSAEVQAPGDPLRTRCLAVGAGHAGDPKLLRGVTVDKARDCAELGPEVVDREVGHLPRRVPVEPSRFPEHGARTARDGVGDERAAIGELPGKRGKRVAGTYPPAVGDDPLRACGERRQERRDVERRRWRARLHVSSRTAPPSGGRITLLAGASVGTPSMRNAEPITVANTGAATSPP